MQLYNAMILAVMLHSGETWALAKQTVVGWKRLVTWLKRILHYVLEMVSNGMVWYGYMVY